VCLSLFYFLFSFLLVSQVIGRSAATIKPEGCAPLEGELNFELRIDRKKVPCRGTPISLVLLADS
jgi:hypothetical protein